MSVPALSATTLTSSAQRASESSSSPSQLWLFVLFAASVIAGSAVILRGGPEWAPVALVALYSSALWLWARRVGAGAHVWAGSAADSPYFLGFLLTLVALYYTLADAATLTAATSGAVGTTPERLLRHAGAALLPTGMGLMARQFFTSKGDVASREVQVSDSATLHAIELTLHRLVQVTEASLHRDEDALAKTLEQVRSALGELNKELIVGKLQEAHDVLLATIKETQQQRKAQLEADLNTTKQWHQALARTAEHIVKLEAAASSASQRVTETGERLNADIVRAATPIVDAYASLTRAVESLDDTLKVRVGAVARAVDHFQHIVTDQTQATEQAAALTAEVATRAKDASDRLTEASGALSQVASAVVEVPMALNQTTAAVEQSAVKLERAVDAAISPVHRQAREIDTMIHDLTRILTTHVEALRHLRG